MEFQSEDDVDFFTMYQHHKYNADLTVKELPGAPPYAVYSLHRSREEYITKLKSKYGVVMFTGPEYTYQEYVEDWNAFRGSLTLEKRALYNLAVNVSTTDMLEMCPRVRRGVEEAKAAIKYARHNAVFFLEN